MKKFLKSRVFAFILGGIILGSIGVYASNILASDISYKDTTVDKALDDLYFKANNQKVATQVATLTTKGASYTMQNDGYITGTLLGEGASSYATVRFQNDNNKLVAFSEKGDANVYTREVSIYAPKGTIVVTRSDYGTYNLTVYEWK